MKRNLLRLAMCLALTLALCPVLASAAVGEKFDVNYIIYIVTSEENHTVAVDSPTDPYSSSVTILPTVNNMGTDYTVTSIGGEAFSYCPNLSDVTIPDSVTSIGEYAFMECNLSTVTIPDSVTFIGDLAFQTWQLTSVTVKATMPPTLGETVFYDNDLKEIIVPYGTAETYKSAGGWSDYAGYITEADPPITLSGNTVEAVIKSDDKLVAEAVAGSVGTLRFIWTIESWDSENGKIGNVGAYIFNFDSFKQEDLDLKNNGHYGTAVPPEKTPKAGDTVSIDLTDISVDQMKQTYYAVPFYKVNEKAVMFTPSPVLSGSVNGCNLNAGK